VRPHFLVIVIVLIIIIIIIIWPINVAGSLCQRRFGPGRGHGCRRCSSDPQRRCAIRREYMMRNADGGKPPVHPPPPPLLSTPPPPVTAIFLSPAPRPRAAAVESGIGAWVRRLDADNTGGVSFVQSSKALLSSPLLSFLSSPLIAVIHRGGEVGVAARRVALYSDGGDDFIAPPESASRLYLSRPLFLHFSFLSCFPFLFFLFFSFLSFFSLASVPRERRISRGSRIPSGSNSETGSKVTSSIPMSPPEDIARISTMVSRCPVWRENDPS